MKYAACVVIALFVFASLGAADAPRKVTLDVSDVPIKDVCDKLAEQAGVTIVLDPAAKGKVTVSLGESNLSEALDVLTKINKLSWKKSSLPSQEKRRFRSIR